MAGEIIGRREELLALEAFLDAAPAGGQALLLIDSQDLRGTRRRGTRELREGPLESRTAPEWSSPGSMRGLSPKALAAASTGAQLSLDP
jgi:hypothetical protein